MWRGRQGQRKGEDLVGALGGPFGVWSCGDGVSAVVGVESGPVQSPPSRLRDFFAPPRSPGPVRGDWAAVFTLSSSSLGAISLSQRRVDVGCPLDQDTPGVRPHRRVCWAHSPLIESASVGLPPSRGQANPLGLLFTLPGGSVMSSSPS